MNTEFTPEKIEALAKVIHRDGWRTNTDINTIEMIVFATVLLLGSGEEDPEEIFYLVKEELVALEDEGGYLDHD